MQINFERICESDLLTLRYFPIAKQQNGWVQEDTTAGVRWRFQQASLGANGASQGPQEIGYKAVKSCQNLSTQKLYATCTASHVFLNASYKSQGFAHGQEMSLGPDRRFAKLHDIGLADWINGRIGRLCE